MRPGLIPILLGRPGWVLPGASTDLDFVRSRAFSGSVKPMASVVAVSRASSGTDLLVASASGASFSTYASNILRVNSSGLLVEESRTNNLLNSTAPVTQTTASLGTGTYTLWVNGSGTATSSAGTATGSGFGAATNGSPNTFTLTGAGTVTVTKSGSLNAFQLETGSFGTSLIVTAGATATRAADVVTLTNPPAFGSAGTAFVQVANLEAPSVSASRRWLEINDGTTSNRILFQQANDTQSQARIDAGAALQCNPLFTVTLSNRQKLALAWTTNDAAGVDNGGTPGTDSSVTVPVVNTVTIGGGASATQADGYIERVALWPNARLPNAVLQSLTA